MIVKKKVLADLPMVYAVAELRVGAGTYYIAASEDRDGGCCMVDGETLESFPLWNEPGGVMSLVPVPGENGAFFAIERFFPIFRSEDSKIIKGKIYFQDGKPVCNRKTVYGLPFTHRIGLMGGDLIACTLCGGKAYQEDWSVPGGVYAGSLQGESMRLILGNLTKNHGLFLQNDRKIALISSHEGVFSLMRQGGGWVMEQWIQEEAGDVFLEDLDGDGQEELLTIQGFHGDRLVAYHRAEGRFHPWAELPISFGHVLWAGKICGREGILAGSRRSEKELAFYAFEPDGAGKARFRKEIIGLGGGPTQVAVCQRGDGTDILAANHGMGQLVLYQVRNHECL